MENQQPTLINKIAFSMLLLFLIASIFSSILGFVVFAHTQFMSFFIILIVIFIVMAITASFFAG